MSDSERRTARETGPDAWMKGALAAVLLGGLAARSVATLAPRLAVGDDGAYYFVQVRAILRGGALAFPDFPLLFYVQAALAWLLTPVMDQRAAIVASVRLTDTVFPLALAVPVFLFARAFERPGERPRRTAAAMALVGLMAVASGNVLFMAGGMIKNAAALPPAFLFAFATCQWLREERPRALFLAALWFVLASLTHMGGFALSAALAAAVMAAGLAVREVRRRVLLPGILLPGCLGASLAIVHALDPARAARLVHTLAEPGWLFAGSPVALWLGSSPVPGRYDALTSAEVWFGNVLGVLGIVTLWRHRAGMDGPTRVLLAAATIVSLFLSSPLLRPEVLERLALLAFVPGMIPVVYLLCREAGAAAVVLPLTLAVMLHGVMAVRTLRQTALVPPAHAELVRFKSALPPGRVIVITRPLLRWWVAWTMETSFSTSVEGALAGRDTYDAVLVLDEVRAGVFGLVPPPPAAGALAAGVRDAALLRAEAVATLTEGTFFRLSAVAPRQEDQ
jgi:hypothetical protein